MSGAATTNLTIGANPGGLSLGVLSVQVIAGPDDQEPIEFVLTSQYRQHTVNVSAGNYTIVARRPNGDRLLRSVTVQDGDAATVNFDVDADVSPTPFLYEEALRGEVSAKAPSSEYVSLSPLSDLELESLQVSPAVQNRSSLKGFAGTSLKAIKTARSTPPASHTLTVRVWFEEETAAPECQSGMDFVKIALKRHCAVGLVDEGGFGPIVINPGFAEGTAITFSAEGVASRAAARSANPSGLRTPVAMVCPADLTTADLLSALASPVVEHAGEVLRQNLNLESLEVGAVHKALDLLIGKVFRPAEALVAAHYLLRFKPDLLPLSWASNLEYISPAADGPIIAAWLVLLSSGCDISGLSESDCEEHFHKHFSKALDRPNALFARTRLLLSKGLSMRDVSTQSRESRKVMPFFEFGAHAGGLEAFWGRGPMSPGPQGEAEGIPYRDVANVDLRGTAFGVFAEIR